MREGSLLFNAPPPLRRFGAAPVKGVQAFADYDEFVELLGRVAPAGVVRFDLR